MVGGACSEEETIVLDAMAKNRVGRIESGCDVAEKKCARFCGNVANEMRRFFFDAMFYAMKKVS
jgi:hypothetical protein